MRRILLFALQVIFLFPVLAQQIYTDDYSREYKTDKVRTDYSYREESKSDDYTEGQFNIYRFNPYFRDWDKDGLADKYDRDDDNDGILDRVDLNQYKNRGYYQPYTQIPFDSLSFKHYYGEDGSLSTFGEYYKQEPTNND